MYRTKSLFLCALAATILACSCTEGVPASHDGAPDVEERAFEQRSASSQTVAQQWGVEDDTAVPEWIKRCLRVQAVLDNFPWT